MYFTSLCRELWSVNNFFKMKFCKCPQVLESWEQGQITIPRTTLPALCRMCMDSLTFPTDQYIENAGVRAYRLWSLSKKTRMSICHDHNKCSTLSSVILRLRTCWSGQGHKPSISSTAIWHPTTWINQKEVRNQWIAFFLCLDYNSWGITA